jgi:hypothetical protein
MKKLTDVINEMFDVQTLLTMPQKVLVSDQDLKELKKMKWQKLVLKEPTETNVGSSTFFNIEFFIEKLNHLAPGIVFKIEQDFRTQLNQPHIQVLKELQGNGIAYNFYRATLEEFGHLVSKKSKRFSDGPITKLYEKLAKDSKIDFFVKNGNYLLLHKDNPEYKETKDLFMTISR